MSPPSVSAPVANGHFSQVLNHPFPVAAERSSPRGHLQPGLLSSALSSRSFLSSLTSPPFVLFLLSTYRHRSSVNFVYVIGHCRHQLTCRRRADTVGCSVSRLGLQHLRQSVRLKSFRRLTINLWLAAAIGNMPTSGYYLTKAMENLFIGKPFISGSSQITFAEIKSISDFWAYCQNILVESFHCEWWYDDSRTPTSDDDRKILYQNALIRLARMRQLKVKNGSCVVHDYFRELFASCYGIFSSRNEDKTNFGMGRWTYKSDQEAGGAKYRGKVATYHSGGYTTSMAQNRNKTVQAIRDLKNALWITRGTRCVFVEFEIYNANVNLFSTVRIVLEFPPTGGVIPSATLSTLQLLPDTSGHSYYIVMSSNVAIIPLLIFYTIAEVSRCKRRGLAYFGKFWNVVGICVVSLGYFRLALEIYKHFASRWFLDAYATGADSRGEYASFTRAVFTQQVYNDVTALFLFLLYISIFKYLSVSKTMGQLNDTLSRCSLEIMSFLVMFTIIFVAYSELGYLLFGTQVEGFRSLDASMSTLYRTILGDFDYVQIQEANSVLAPVFFITYIFLVFFVLMNMFLAIIDDTYSDVKTELSMSHDQLPVSHPLRKLWNKLDQFLRCFQRHTECKPSLELGHLNDQIVQILQTCGFGAAEIEMFFSRFSADTSEGEMRTDKKVASRKNLENLRDQLELLQIATDSLSDSVRTLLDSLRGAEFKNIRIVSPK